MSFNIMIVDDSSTVRCVIRKALRMAQVPIEELLEAENGEEALAQLAVKRVDIMFADINMPVMTGVEMVNKMHEHGMLETTPVVMISTEGSHTRIDELLEKGVRGFIRKPFRPEQLRDIISEVLGKPHE